MMCGNKNIRVFLIGLLFTFLFWGCSVSTDTITQVSNIDALLAGAYDGSISGKQLLEYGDFGIGTFDKLDGEMVILNGKIYQVKSDGKVYTPDDSILIPFADICSFTQDEKFTLEGKPDYKKIEEIIDNHIADKNIFYAVKIHGTFSKVKTRSVPRQSKPYIPLAEVTKNQSVFNLENVSGTIVGYRFPAFVKGVNVTGYHFHFLSDDMTKGGHVLDFTLDEGICELDKYNRYLLIMPEDGKALEEIDFSKDRSGELDKVEK